MSSSAVLSVDGVYRYELWRTHLNVDALHGRMGTVAFCMLNPSTADASADDATIRRCIGYARRWGYHSLAVVNLYPYRARQPADLWRWLRQAPGGELHMAQSLNADHVARVLARAQLYVAAWGAHGRLGVAGELEARYQWWCLGHTRDGSPLHPLYQPLAADLVRL